MIVRTAALAFALAFGPALPAHAQPAAGQAVQRAEGREILVMLRMPPSHYRPNARYSGNYDSRAAQQARRRVAAEIARDNGLELVEGWPMPLIGVDCYVMRVPEGRAIDELIAAISRHRMVAWSQPRQTYETLATGPRQDPLFAAQPSASAWRLADLHGIATGRGVTIAVIDSKVQLDHPDLAGQFQSSRDFFTAGQSPAEAHGTGVAGVIGAKPGNGVGIVGIAPGARLMALRACFERRRAGTTASTSVCDSLTLAKALNYAIERGADVINMSLTGPPDPLLASLIEVGLARDIAVVTAFAANRPGGGFPASMPGVISVAEESLRSVPERVYLAPGQDIPTTQPGGRWYLVNGSSYAAAHVAGLLALVRERRGSAGLPARIVRSAGGVVDACATLVPVTRDCNCSCTIDKTLADRRN